MTKDNIVCFVNHNGVYIRWGTIPSGLKRFSISRIDSGFQSDIWAPSNSPDTELSCLKPWKKGFKRKFTANLSANVEGFPEPKRILSGLRNANVKRVTLLPLMVVAGDHAANDMAGDEPDSWKNMFKRAGIEVIPVLRGLGELDSWANIYVQHLKEAMADNEF